MSRKRICEDWGLPLSRDYEKGDLIMLRAAGGLSDHLADQDKWLLPKRKILWYWPFRGKYRPLTAEEEREAEK